MGRLLAYTAKTGEEDAERNELANSLNAVSAHHSGVEVLIDFASFSHDSSFSSAIYS